MFANGSTCAVFRARISSTNFFGTSGEGGTTMVRLWSFVPIGALLLGTLPASVQADTAPRKQRIAKDPNERICEDITVIGSRLAVKRVCATRAEWAEKRKLDREAIDNAQRHAADPCNAILTHSGPPVC
jgi:hypothetical protein